MLTLDTTSINNKFIIQGQQLNQDQEEEANGTLLHMADQSQDDLNNVGARNTKVANCRVFLIERYLFQGQECIALKFYEEKSSEPEIQADNNKPRNNLAVETISLNVVGFDRAIVKSQHFQEADHELQISVQEDAIQEEQDQDQKLVSEFFDMIQNKSVPQKVQQLVLISIIFFLALLAFCVATTVLKQGQLGAMEEGI